MDGSTWFWGVCVAVGLLLVALAWYGKRRRRLRPVEVDTATEAVCAYCGYDVRGLPGHICPECGSDLNTVGRLTARFRRWQRVPPLLRGLTWTLVVIGVGAFLLRIAWRDHLPMRLQLVTSDAFGTSPRFEATELAQWTFPGGNHGRTPFATRRDQTPAWHVRYVIPVGANATPGLRLERDYANNCWRLELPNEPPRAGDGLPPAEAIDAFVTAPMGNAATQPAKVTPALATKPALMENDARLLPITPQRIRLMLWVELRNTLPVLYRTADEQARWNERYRGFSETSYSDFNWWDHWSAEIDELPPGWFEGDVDDFLLLAHELKVGSRGNNESVRPELLPVALAIGWWLLVWIVGGVFVVRRRSVREVQRAQDPTASR